MELRPVSPVAARPTGVVRSERQPPLPARATRVGGAAQGLRPPPAARSLDGRTLTSVHTISSCHAVRPKRSVRTARGCELRKIGPDSEWRGGRCPRPRAPSSCRGGHLRRRGRSSSDPARDARPKNLTGFGMSQSTGRAVPLAAAVTRRERSFPLVGRCGGRSRSRRARCRPPASPGRSRSPGASKSRSLVLRSTSRLDRASRT